VDLQEQDATSRNWWQLTRTELAGWISGAFFVVIAFGVTRQKEPPGFAYIALLVFGAVPIALLLKGELSKLAFLTPAGKYGLVAEKNDENLAVANEIGMVEEQLVQEPPNEDHPDKLAPPTPKAQPRPTLPKKAYWEMLQKLNISEGLEEIQNGTLVRITGIAPFDAYRNRAMQLIDHVGTTVGPLIPTVGGYYQGHLLVPSSPFGDTVLSFAGVQVKVLNFPKGATSG
jgi:hypothetical protein